MKFPAILFIVYLISFPQFAQELDVSQGKLTGSNTPPTITGQENLSTNEEKPIEISFSDLDVSDPDNDYPEDFTMNIAPGPNYSVNNRTVTPAENFTGTLEVKVTVNDGTSDSSPYPLKIEVQPKNDRPVIQGQVELQMEEDQELTIQLTDLIVYDPDNVYPDDFILKASDGSNYSEDDNTITPEKDYYGELTVPVRVSDGDAESEVFNLKVTVNSVNDIPVIIGQDPLQTKEKEPITILLTNLSVTDPDNTYPEDFTMVVYDGSNYSVSGSTVTPDQGFSGTLSIPVSVSDGTSSSQQYALKLSVSSVNDPPVITGQQPLSTPEDQALTIALTDLIVSDPDNDYPEDFTLQISGGENYSVTGSAIKPDQDFAGTLTIPVTVNDGLSNSNVFDLKVSVDPVNDPPVIEDQVGLTTGEEQPLKLELQHLIVNDPDNKYPEDFSLSVFEGTNYTVSGTTVTPENDFTGTITVPVSVNDGISSSAIFQVEISVGGSNDPPVITGQVALSTPEETPITITLDDLTVTDPDNDYPGDFTLFIGSGDNYTVSGTTVTPADNFAGTLVIPVSVNDGGASSELFNLQVQVTGVNDTPVITGQKPLSVDEDTPITVALSDLTVSDSDNNYPDGFTMTISSGADYSVNGATITPSLNYSGTLSVPVTVNDGTNTSPEFKLSITVNPVNDPPVIKAQVPLTVKEDGSITLAVTDFTVEDPDNSTGFLLYVLSGQNYSVSGTTVTPASDFTGTLTVGVTVSDGSSTSVVFNALINVEGDNDAPVITGQLPLEINEEQPFTIQLSHLIVTDQDNTYPQGFTLHVSGGSGYTLSGETIKPELNFYGMLSVPVKVNDGTSMSNSFDLQIQVNAVNDAPVITGQKTLSTYKNKSITVQLTDLVVSDPDNNYPEGFTMNMQEGPNHSVIDQMVTPKNNFLGMLNVPVTVNDGASVSLVYGLRIEVVAPPNVVPVITSQVSLSTFENQPITLQLSHLVVSDPDNLFPNDFKLALFPGQNYSLNGNSIIPAKDFNGILSVKVTVSDKESTSEPYFVQIEVVPVSDAPLITSQQFLKMNEESSLTLNFSHITVIDPDNSYPTGFTFRAGEGTNYTIEGLTIRPVKDFNGYLSVPVTVNDGTNNSNTYQLLILVEPLNDPPVITDSRPGEIVYIPGRESIRIFESFQLSDVDDDTLTIAEITIDPTAFQQGNDSLGYQPSQALRSIYDRATGTMVVFGNAPINDYQAFIQNITYGYRGSTPPRLPRVISVSINDGKAKSNEARKTITFGTPSVLLDIPSGFTPNGDGTNDTWSVRPQGNVDFTEAVIRIYNKSGVIVFEAKGIEKEWDGRMNGALLPAETYFYTIDVNGSALRNSFKGIITILR